MKLQQNAEDLHLGPIGRLGKQLAAVLSNLTPPEFARLHVIDDGAWGQREAQLSPARPARASAGSLRHGTQRLIDKILG